MREAIKPVNSERGSPSSLLDLLQAVFSAWSFSLLLAGVNATTPLVPIYRQVLGFTPLTIALTYVLYVGMLVGILLVMSRPSRARWSPVALFASLLIAAAAAFLGSTANEQAILLGRAMTGVAVGLGTGTASALVVTVLGNRGRSVSATGNTVGAIVGTIVAQQLVNAGGAHAIASTFNLHAWACLVTSIPLAIVLFKRRRANDVQLHQPRKSNAQNDTRIDWRPLTIGSLAWISAASTVVFMPTFFNMLGMANVQSHCILVMLPVCALAQLGAPWLRKIAPGMRGPGSVSVGIACILIGAAVRSDALALFGFAMLGLGFGMAYRLCLLACVRHATPAEQAALSSKYAAVTYLSSMAGVLLGGALGNLVGLPAATYLLFGLAALALVPLMRFAPKLGEVG